MGEQSKIEWTDHTFNPWWGCVKVSPACDNCYAERDAARYMPGVALWGVGTLRRTFGQAHWAEPIKWNKQAAAAGVRRRVFCASMADVFDKEAPTAERQRLWGVIENTPSLDWLLLTKRVGNVKNMLPLSWLQSPRPNVWLGISVVNQAEAMRDVPKLLEIPAAVRFLSCEPLLELLALDEVFGLTAEMTGCCTDEDCEWCAGTNERMQGPRPDWIIVGGESGPNARPMAKSWVDRIHEFCIDYEVPFFFKQWGEWRAPMTSDFVAGAAGMAPKPLALRHEYVGDEYVMRLGKKAAGRMLDGAKWSEFPQPK